MAMPAHYRIDYLLNGRYKTLYVSASGMSNEDAWHWAAVDSGFAPIPKLRSNKARKVSKPFAERYGIGSVEWSRA